MIGLATYRAARVVCFAALSLIPAFSQTVKVSPTSVSFGNQVQGTSSPVHTVTLKNGQSTAITITSIATNLLDYATTSNCPTSPATLGVLASCTISITFTPGAQGTRSGTLTVTDSGTSSPQLVTLSGTGTAPTLVSIAVSPNLTSIAAGNTLQFAATGTYTDGSTRDLTATASWTSSNISIASIGFHTALAKGIKAGAATITAVSGKISGAASLTVTAAVLTSISVAPSTASIATGGTQQFTATGTYSNGTKRDLTNAVTWSSSAISVATISNGGLAVGVGMGTATITATSGAITASATLSVGQPVLVSLAVTPANPSLALGTTLPMVATGTYSDGSTLVLTTSVTWTTGNTSIATVSSQGVASSVAVGSTAVTATSGTISGLTTLTVTPATLVSIAVTPAIPTIATGATLQFTATGTYTDGSTQNITGTAQWSSDVSAVATISSVPPNPGLASGTGAGTATITATSGSVTGSTKLTVTSAALVSLAVTPATPSIALGTSQKFTATGTFSDGSKQDMTATVTWSSDTVSAATINSAGLAQGVGVGTANISATSGTVTGSTQLTVTAATLVSIAINPQTATVALGATQQFTAAGTYSDGSTQDLTQSGQWSSNVPTVATISVTAGTAGLATALGIGTTTIGISSGSVSASATLVVNPAALVSIAITPQNPTISLGLTQQFTATGTYTDGSAQDLTGVVSWSSSATAVATIAAGGLATGQASGTTTISATSGAITATATLSVGSSSPMGQWSAPVYFCPGTPCVVGANAIVLNNGKVLFNYYPPYPGTGSQAMVLDPITGNLTSVNLTVANDIFCSGLTILPNGVVMVTGGVLEGSHTGAVNNRGTTTTMLFDPGTSTWTVGSNMSYARWYPTSVELADGTELELSGSDETGKVIQPTLESYNYSTGTWAILPASANIPADALQVYPRMSLLPSGKVFLSAPAANTYLFDPTTNTWSFIAASNFGFRYFAPHVLLPGQQKILVAGGSLTHFNGGADATNTAEIIDMSAANPAWVNATPMNYARYNENLVLLPDGSVLAVGGGGGGGQYTNPVLAPELYDPKTGQWTVMASQAIQRTYHSTAVLLPDGRVLSSGSDNGASTEHTYEIFSPPYLFNGARPVIQAAPASIGYGSSFTITTADASTITRVALIRPSATTHADNMDQRYVDLTFTTGSGTIQATAPANGNLAPPGYYMLVIVNANGVPSVMPFLLLD